MLFRAPLEEAHVATAWEVYQLGSLYHWEGDVAAPGLFGQTLSGFVDSEGGFQTMYPSKKANGIGTISLQRVRCQSNYGIVS